MIMQVISCSAGTSFNRVVVAPSRAASNTCSSNFLSAVRSAADRAKKQHNYNQHWKKTQVRMQSHVAFSGNLQAYVSCHASNPYEESLVCYTQN